jgi:hypothetical protein
MLGKSFWKDLPWLIFLEKSACRSQRPTGLPGFWAPARFAGPAARFAVVLAAGAVYPGMRTTPGAAQ